MQQNDSLADGYTAQAVAVRGERTIPLAAFEQQITEALAAGADLIVHTGDLLNFPSPKAAEAAAAALAASGLPWLFLAGNHDWCGCPPSDRRCADWCGCPPC